MTEIPMYGATKEFEECYRAAAAHAQRAAGGERLSWVRLHLNPPFLEHFSFYYGNQLFFVRVEDEDGTVDCPGSRDGLRYIAGECNGYACLMPMRRVSGKWRAVLNGWGLIDSVSRQLVNPPDKVTDERIELTDWELQDFAVQIVRRELENDGRRLMSWQTNPSVDPSVWFVGDEGPEWVIVRAVRVPDVVSGLPENWRETASQCSALSRRGSFAAVSFATDESRKDGRIIRAMPADFNWSGLMPLE